MFQFCCEAKDHPSPLTCVIAINTGLALLCSQWWGLFSSWSSLLLCSLQTEMQRRLI